MLNPTRPLALLASTLPRKRGRDKGEIMALIGRIIVITFGLIAAIMAAGVTLAIGVVAPDWGGVDSDPFELYLRTLTSFYKKFKKDLSRAGKEMIDLKKGIEIGEACDKCGLPMLKRVGKFGPFIACSGYPECTNTREVETGEPESESGEEEIEPCENCGKPMAMKRGRFGQFLACTGYPECKTTR